MDERIYLKVPASTLTRLFETIDDCTKSSTELHKEVEDIKDDVKKIKQEIVELKKKKDRLLR